MDFSHIFKANPYHDNRGRFTAKDKTGTKAPESPAPKKGKVYSEAEVHASVTRLMKSPAIVNNTGDSDEHSFLVKGHNVPPRAFAKAFHEATQGRALPEDLLHAITGTGIVTEGASGRVKLQVSPSEDGISSHPNHVSIDTYNLKVAGVRTLAVDRNYNFDTNTVDHTYFALPPTEQGAGISKALFKSALPVYDQLGMTAITTHANLDAGGYVWGRFGFKASDPKNHRHFVGSDAGQAALNGKLIAKYAAGAGKRLERAFALLPKPIPEAAAKEIAFLRNVVAVGKTPGAKNNEHVWREFPRAYANASVKHVVAHMATSPRASVRKFAALLSKDNPRKLLTRGVERSRAVIDLSPEAAARAGHRQQATRRHFHWMGELDLTHAKTRAHLEGYLK